MLLLHITYVTCIGHVEKNSLSWGHEDDSKWIDGRLASIVKLFNVNHVHCATDSGGFANVFGVIEDIWILVHWLLVAFEVKSIDLPSISTGVLL